MKKPLSNRDIVKLCVEAQNLITAIEESNEYRKRLQTITEDLMGHDLTKHGLALYDNFTEKNLQWKSTPFSRFEIVKVGHAPRRAAKTVSKQGELFKIRRSR